MCDPITAGALIAGGASLGGSKMESDSAQWANTQNERLMREAWARDDSAIQRKVADLKAAGLHPSLATGGGMSSTPTTIQETIKDNPVEQAIQSVQRQRDIAMSKTQQEINEAQLKIVQSQANIAEKDADLYLKQGLKYDSTTGKFVSIGKTLLNSHNPDQNPDHYEMVFSPVLKKRVRQLKKEYR